MKKIKIILLLQLLSVYIYAQYSIEGQISDMEGKPLFGCNVQIKGTFIGAYSDLNGNFRLTNIQAGNYILQVSYIGYEKAEKAIQLEKDQNISIILTEKAYLTDEVVIQSTRAGENTPVSYANLSQEEIQEQNFGQDIPYLLTSTPSLVSSSDAGTGIGYTNYRIRGTDLNRINVTLNGIPMNDAESHGVWWVDLPDFAESVDNIQIQRGVGTSSHGTSAFGASINLQTTTFNAESYARYRITGGSFNTLKNTLAVGSGLLNDHFIFDARFSKINSDGFIDRSSVDLKSFFISGGYYTKKSILRLNIFSGLEETYQAWWGVPSVRLNNDEEGMLEYLNNWLFSEKEYQHMIKSDSRTYNYYTYENQVDHYQQDHYQMLFSHELNSDLHFNAAAHYTYGRGYYEEYQDKEYLYDDVNLFYDYGIDSLAFTDTVIYNSDIIRRKWLDNDFYGFNASLNYKKQKTEFSLGGSWNNYDGRHFGRIKWAEYMPSASYNYEWYRNTGNKSEMTIFGKVNYQLNSFLNLYGDFQFRHIDYQMDGIDDDFTDITQSHQYNFINPKLGLFFRFNEFQATYFSFGMANREPNRSNFIDADESNPLPEHETLINYEFGYKFATTSYTVSANLYYMDYQNQLVLTGKINDVGAAIMNNVDKSYRTGIELVGAIKFSEWIEWEGNMTLSRNKITNFTEYVDDWNTGAQVSNNLGETDISFSPNIIANSDITFVGFDGFEASFISSYVGDQYIDNTSNADRMLDAYFVNNLRLSYSVESNIFEKIGFHFLVNNILNTEYETNAWVYRYQLGDTEYKQDGYFPQAGIHFLGGLSLEF
jgi:iron complex outermembrane receptor protein